MSFSEAEYATLCEDLFTRLEDFLDEQENDLDYESNGDICEITLADSSKLIINRQPPVQEIWLAAKSGGYHFAYRDNQWSDTRDGMDFFTRLTICLGGD